MTTTSLPRVPEGLRDLMKVYTKEVLREKPADLYEYSAKFFNLIVAEKSHQVVRKYEPVQTYETIMKNRIRQQVPLSMVFNIIPETLTDLIKKFIKAVLREKPENIYIFAQEYFQRLSKEKSGRIEYTKYSTYEKSLKDKENVAPVSKVTCECGRVLSAQGKDLGKAVATKLESTPAEQTTISSSISYVKSVVIIQRHFRRYLKQKKIGREKNKCNSVEYMTAIILIQRQFRRVLAKKRVEQLKKSRPGQLSYVKFNAANYMKAVVVIQRHYRIYLKKKQEQNRLKTDPVSLATAAIIIQRAFRRMVAVRRARRTASVTADPGEELNDNASETGSYTSVSTALLSTESTELGIASYEEKVHQKIIHEDEEVENNNVDASLEKEYFAEPIKGDDKSIDPRKSEILSGALIESRILKNSLEKEKDLNKESADLDLSGSDHEKPLDPVIEDEFTAKKASKQTGSPNESALKTAKNSREIQEENEEILAREAEKPLVTEIEDDNSKKPLAMEIEDELTAIKAGKQLDSAIETEIKSKNISLDLQQEIKAEPETKIASVDMESEVKDDPKTTNIIKDKEPEIEDEVKTKDKDKDPVKGADEVVEGSALSKNIENIETNDIKELVSKDIEDTPQELEDKKNNENVIIPSEKLTTSESQEMPEKPIEAEVTPKVSIEIELVDDVPEQDLPDSNVTSGNDLSDIDTMEEQPKSMPTVEIDSLKTVLANHNREVRDQESFHEIIPDEDTEKLGDTATEIAAQKEAASVAGNSTNKQENEVSAIKREKRSLDDTENVVTHPQPQSMETQQSLSKRDEESSSMTEEKKSIEVTESQSNLVDQDFLNKLENEASPLTREKRSIEGTESVSQKSSLDVQEPIKPDDEDSNITKIDQEVNSVEKDQQTILNASAETSPEMGDKYKETKEEVTDLVDAETGEITVHKVLEEVAETLKQEITTDEAPQADLIADTTNVEDQKSEMETELLVSDKKSSMETSELTETEKEEGTISHLEVAVGLLIDPQIIQEQKNNKNNPEEATNSVNKVPNDPSDASEEPESLEEDRKLSHQETIPIGLDPSQVEDTASADVKTGIKVDSIEDQNNKSDNLSQEANTGETTAESKNKSKPSAIISASSVFGEDTSNISMEAESERIKREISVDSTSNENGINATEQNVETSTQAEEDEVIEPTKKITTDKAQQSTGTNEGDSVASAVKIPNEGSESLQADEETEETVPLEPKTISVEDSNVIDESTRLEKGSSLPEKSEAPIIIESKEITTNQRPDITDKNSKDSKESLLTSMEKTPSLESFKNNEKLSEESSVADLALAIVPVLEENRTISLNETDQEPIPKENDITEVSVIPTGIADNPETSNTKTKDDEGIPLMARSLSEGKPKDISESLEDTKTKSDVEKQDSVEDPNVPQADDETLDSEAKPKGSETSNDEDLKQSSSLEDTTTPISNEKAPTSVPPHPEKKSSLLVSNQLIGTQNLPTNRIEIEKNTKKLSSAGVKDKDIGTLTSGRLVPTPIAELQLKSFKAPNDDGAWYDIYVEPQLPSDKDLDNPPAAAAVSTDQSSNSQQINPEKEPSVVAERVPSYYTPQEIVEPNVPKAKNSVSFFVSFESDDGKPKYKIPKKFQDKTKTEGKKSDPEPENNEEDIEVIEVSEGDPEYQQMGGSKLQTIMELNENEQSNECGNEGSALQVEVSESPRDVTEKDPSDLEDVIRSESLSENNNENQVVNSTKRDAEHYESVYKTDILNLTRSVQIIETAYRRFKNRRLLESQKSSDYQKQHNAAIIIQKWVRDFLKKKSPMKIKDISQETKESLAARKIQKAYRRYAEKPKESDVEMELPSEERAEKEKRAALVIQKAFRVYSQKNLAESTKQSSDRMKLKQNQAARKIQRAYKRYLKKDNTPKMVPDFESEEPIKVYKLTEVNASPNSNPTTLLSSEKVKEGEQIQEDSSRPSSSPAQDQEATSRPSSSLEQDVSGSTELNQHQAAEKIQRAFRRYLKESNKADIDDFRSEESIKTDKSVTNSTINPSSSKDESKGMTKAALIIQRAFRQYMERRKLENFDEISLDSITSSRITAIENSMCPTEGTPSDSLIQEEIPSEDATKISSRSEWFVGSTRIVPSQEVVEEPLELETEPDPAEMTRNTELDTSTQVESVETVDRSHGSLESKLTPGISSSEIDQGNTSKQDNAVSSGLAGLTEAPEAGAGSAEDQVLLSQADLGSIFQTLDIASTQELVNDFLMNEINFSSAQGPYLIEKQLEEVIEEPCIKRSASLVSLSEGETGNDSSKSEATGLDTLSADTIDKATVKLSKPEEVIEKMAQLRDSKSSERILSAEPSFEEPIVRPMSSLQEQSSLDIEDGDIIVYKRLQRDETRESSAQSDSVVFGDAESEKILDKEMATEEESGRVHLMRHYTIAGDDPRGLFRSVTIDDALNYGEMGEKDLDASLGINSTNSFYLDDETSENIRKKMMAYSLSETDSDYFDPKKMSKEDFDIDTAMADAMGTSTETESTIVSAATKIQAGARGFLTRRRLRRASAGTKSSTMDTKASFGNDAISESLERFIEEEAAKKIQTAYRMHTRKRKGKTRRMEGISLESNLAARRQKLQRGDALRNDSTPDDDHSGSTNGGQAQKNSKGQRTKAVGEAKSRAAMELKWLTMRQNSMPVQIDCEVFRVIPKHMRKRIKSAEASKRK